MTFEDAIREYKKGKKIRRDSWVEEDRYLDNKQEIDTFIFTKNYIYADDWIVIEEPILDEEEKAYLEGVLYPFKEKVVSIVKGYYNFGEDEYIYIYLKKGKGIELPTFKKNSMYKRMIPAKGYTLQELGLFK